MPQIVIKKQGTQWDHYVDLHNKQRKHSPATDLLIYIYIYIYIYQDCIGAIELCCAF